MPRGVADATPLAGRATLVASICCHCKRHMMPSDGQPAGPAAAVTVTYSSQKIILVTKTVIDKNPPSDEQAGAKEWGGIPPTADVLNSDRNEKIRQIPLHNSYITHIRFFGFPRPKRTILLRHADDCGAGDFLRHQRLRPDRRTCRGFPRPQIRHAGHQPAKFQSAGIPHFHISKWPWIRRQRVRGERVDGVEKPPDIGPGPTSSQFPDADNRGHPRPRSLRRQRCWKNRE